jgi:Protein of unknown function (DUF3106)
MSRRFQFAGWLAAPVLGVLVVFPAHGQNRPPKNQPRQEQRQQRQEQRPGRDQQHANAPRNANRPPERESVVPNTNRPPERARNQQNLNRPLQNTQPRNFNNLNPQEKQRTLDNYRNYQKLPPGQKQQMQEAARNWNRLSPEQRNHIKNDIMPRWQQLPPQRQRAIQQRLGVLKNMPESARNQHLADPNFTRGMSEEDKATLRDLAHLHVGGAPEPPNE